MLAGRHCQHMETSSSGQVATSCSSSLEDYLNTLTVSCEGDESEAAILTWTPDDNTPDLVYYQVSYSNNFVLFKLLDTLLQCANHFHLGWRIEVSSGTIVNMEDTEDTSGSLVRTDNSYIYQKLIILNR